MSSQLVWQLVKNNNCFMHKGLNGVVLSKEPGNLYNVHCYKYSGLANDKAIHIEADGQGLKVTKLISKHASKPSKAKSSSTRKKSFQRVSHGLNKELDGYRPDLKKAALARASAVNRSSKGSKQSTKKE
ncbi:hypothetical protein ABBQ32_010270 [Trebouxia sp. C0010 RCD-2024]